MVGSAQVDIPQHQHQTLELQDHILDPAVGVLISGALRMGLGKAAGVEEGTHYLEVVGIHTVLAGHCIVDLAVAAANKHQMRVVGIAPAVEAAIPLVTALREGNLLKKDDY